MSQFHGLPLAILRSVSELSGDTYSDVDGEELMQALASRGHELESQWDLRGVMFALRDSGHLEWHRGGAGKYNHIRLGTRGREEVESWPKLGAVSTIDVQALLTLLSERADDTALPDLERGKARMAFAAMRDLGVGVTTEIAAAWLKSIGAAP